MKYLSGMVGVNLEDIQHTDIKECVGMQHISIL
jgi:hypothetical protein